MAATKKTETILWLYFEMEKKKKYLEQPGDFEDGGGRVYHLKESLYGLKQALFWWNKRFI